MSITREVQVPVRSVESHHGSHEREEVAEELGEEALESAPVEVRLNEAAGPIVGEIDVSYNAEQKAYAIADRRVEELKEENAQRFLLNPKRIARTIWGYKGTHRAILSQARADIRQSGDVNAGDTEFDATARVRYGEAIFDQFFNGPREAIDEAAGEKREFFADDHEATIAAKELYADFIESDNMTDDDFNQRLQDVRQKMGEHLSDTAKGEVILDNYLEVARAMRGRRQHGEAVESTLDGFRLMRAEARSDSRTEVHRTKIDKLLDKYEDSRFGGIVPATLLANGVAVGAFLATKGATTVARAATFAGGGVVIGAVAGAKEHAEITRQRALREQETFRGKVYTNGTKRERALSEFEYNRRHVDTLLDELTESSDRLHEGQFDRDIVNTALDRLSTISLLKDLSAEKGIDLFDHGASHDPTKHLTDRIEMARFQAEIKQLLVQAIESGNGETLALFGVSDLGEVGDPGELLEGALMQRAEAFRETYLTDIDAKDAAFHKYRRRESIKKGVKVGALSLVAGATIQEAISMVSDDSSGLVEQLWGADNNPSAHDTVLASMFHSGGGSTEFINHQLSSQEISDLRSDGATVIDHTTTTVQKVPGSMSLQEYIANRPNGELRHFGSVDLYTNQTTAPDLNELGGQLSYGSDGSVHPWDTMIAEGSFTAHSSIDMTTGPNVFDIAIKQPDGTHLHKIFEYGQDVPKPWADMFYQKDNGTWGFKGEGYIAWGQTAGDHLDVAASIAGDGEPVMIDTTQLVEVQEYAYEVIRSNPDVPPAVWLSNSERLGTARRRSPYEYSYSAGGYDRASRIQDQRLWGTMEDEVSPSIMENPQAGLRPHEELRRYRAEIERRRGSEVVRRIEEVIQQVPEFTSNNNDLETIVTIPVGAAFESENIFNVLSLYAQQEAESLRKTVILLNVNWLDSIESDSGEMEKVQSTLAEIERARQQFPQLHIATIQNVYNQEEVDKTGGVVGYFAQDLVDTALLAIQQGMAAGNIPEDRSIMIQRHDADMLGMSHDHLASLQEAARRYPSSDLFRGTTRFDIQQSEDYPGWGITSDIVNMTSIWAIQEGAVRTGGANFAVRAETLAAVGGLGDLTTAEFGSKAGSDDVSIGRRVAVARDPKRRAAIGKSASYGTAYTETSESTSTKEIRIMRHVAGMTIDTNSERFLPIYLRGGDWNSAWTQGEGSFDRGVGGYGARDQEDISRSLTRPERYGAFGPNDFGRLEETIGRELGYQDAATRRRVLALFFRDAPGAYRLQERGGQVCFELTRVGRRFVRQRINHYGRRKITGLYGSRQGRSVLGRRAPLVQQTS